MTKNRAESIKQRLLNLARERKEDFNFVLRQFVLQRLMYRISVSEFSDDFMLKGGLLFWVWHKNFHRPTQDMDLLGFGSSELAVLKDKFLNILHIESDDGLVFVAEKLNAMEIKEQAKYQGIRMTGRALLVKADIPFQVDIGFGDAVAVVEDTTDIPIFLDDLPVPKLKVYPVEIVIAEKFQAMVSLGLANSRMKDFFDIVTLANTLPLQSEKLQSAIQATFDRRETPIKNDVLYIFSDEFKTDHNKQKQWQAFIRKNRLTKQESFEVIVDKIQCLLEPIYQNIITKTLYEKQWDINTGRWK